MTPSGWYKYVCTHTKYNLPAYFFMTCSLAYMVMRRTECRRDISWSPLSSLQDEDPKAYSLQVSLSEARSGTEPCPCLPIVASCADLPVAVHLVTYGPSSDIMLLVHKATIPNTDERRSIICPF